MGCRLLEIKMYVNNIEKIGVMKYGSYEAKLGTKKVLNSIDPNCGSFIIM